MPFFLFLLFFFSFYPNQLLYHRGWFKAVEAAKSGLNASLLVRHPETKVYAFIHGLVYGLFRKRFYTSSCCANNGAHKLKSQG